jgi:Dolichyl-phosphate-mannose-protein mannosyltransferase
MGFLVSLSALACTALLFAVALAFGFRILALSGLPDDRTFTSALFAAGISFPLIGFAVFGLSLPGWLGLRSAWALVLVLAIAAGPGWFRLQESTLSVLKRVISLASTGGSAIRAVTALLISVFSLEALIAVAPLTGSDAMHYHFTVPLLELGKPLQPIFWLTPSFLTGQAHLLISLGLALGSERVSLGLIFLGGILAAGTLYVIARDVMACEWALLVVLAFLITPMVFWQMTTSGSPDIWMAFYTGLAVIAASRGIERGNSRFVLLAGFYAGAAAGVKYTGWVVPFAVCLYFLIACRSWRWTLSCGLASVIAGSLAQVRNFVWTGDPFFPFLMRRLHPASVNSLALHSLVIETRASDYSLRWDHLLGLPFQMVLDGDRFGLGQYFGPLVLAFAPLLIYARWKSQTAKLAGTVWALLFASNALSTQMGRFLLPAYGLALALLFSGLAEIFKRRWKVSMHGCAATLTLFLAFALASDLVYARDFLPVVLGQESQEDFLQRMAPDYKFASFVNATLGARTQSGDGRVMLFFRHLYYLRVPYIYGDPAFSWVMDPAKCNQAGCLLRTLQDLNVRWVVKAPVYPPALAEAFSRLETDRHLVPIATAELETSGGPSRIYKEKQAVPVTILELEP